MTLRAVQRQTAEVIDLLQIRRRIAQLIRPHLFHKVRLGYAVWHTLAVAKRPLTPEEVFEAMTRGDVFTTADDFTVRNVMNALRYHTKAGKLRYRGHGHYTIA